MQADFNTAAVPVMTVNSEGTKEWRLNGLLHREDGPAFETADGYKSWFRNDTQHREGGPAIEDPDGTKSWYRNGQLHRDDGPAIEYASGSKEWYRNGMLHREDGPAVESSDGRTKDWFINHIYLEAGEIQILEARIQQQKVIELRKAMTEGFSSAVVAPTSARFKPRLSNLKLHS